MTNIAFLYLAEFYSVSPNNWHFVSNYWESGIQHTQLVKLSNNWDHKSTCSKCDNSTIVITYEGEGSLQQQDNLHFILFNNVSQVQLVMVKFVWPKPLTNKISFGPADIFLLKFNVCNLLRQTTNLHDQIWYPKPLTCLNYFSNWTLLTEVFLRETPN